MFANTSVSLRNCSLIEAQSFREISLSSLAFEPTLFSLPTFRQSIVFRLAKLERFIMLNCNAFEQPLLPLQICPSVNDVLALPTKRSAARSVSNGSIVCGASSLGERGGGSVDIDDPPEATEQTTVRRASFSPVLFSSAWLTEHFVLVLLAR